jgi:hypothetical protein
MSVKQLNIDKWDKIPCECGKMAPQSRLQYKGYNVRGWKCRCGKEYIHPADSVRISKLEQMEPIKVTVGIVGQSTVIRIPKGMSEVYQLRKGEQVELIPESLQRLEIRVK